MNDHWFLFFLIIGVVTTAVNSFQFHYTDRLDSKILYLIAAFGGWGLMLFSVIFLK